MFLENGKVYVLVVLNKYSLDAILHKYLSCVPSSTGLSFLLTHVLQSDLVSRVFYIMLCLHPSAQKSSTSLFLELKKTQSSKRHLVKVSSKIFSLLCQRRGYTQILSLSCLRVALTYCDNI